MAKKSLFDRSKLAAAENAVTATSPQTVAPVTPPVSSVSEPAIVEPEVIKSEVNIQQPITIEPEVIISAPAKEEPIIENQTQEISLPDQATNVEVTASSSTTKVSVKKENARKISLEEFENKYSKDRARKGNENFPITLKASREAKEILDEISHITGLTLVDLLDRVINNFLSENEENLIAMKQKKSKKSIL